MLEAATSVRTDASPSPSGSRSRSPSTLFWTALAGLNLWLVATVLPMLVGLPDAPRLPTGALSGLCVAALTTLLALALGIRRRSDLVLLGLIPALALLPAAVASAGPNPLWAPPPLWALLLALLTYLAVACQELRPATGLSASLPKAPKMVGRKWARRERIYRVMAVAAAVFPSVLVWQLNRHDVRRELELTFVGHAGGVRALLIVGVALVSLSAQRVGLLSPLQRHLELDPQMRADVAELKRVAERGRPRVQFYIWVALALLGVVLTAWYSR